MEQRIGYHIYLIDFVCRLLPISSITVEEAKFDTHKIQNPYVEGVGYQRGPQYGFENVKEYVRCRDGYKCRKCGSKTHLEVHHIIQRKDGGANRPDNLVTLCHECHAALHRGEFTLQKPKGGYKEPAFMNKMRNKLVERLKAKYGNMIHTTFGYITRIVRTAAELPKNHNTDARVISGNAEVRPNGIVWNITKYRCHNRKLHREVPSKYGRRQATQSAHRVFGFGLHDKVAVTTNDTAGYITGLRTSGTFVIRDANGDPVAECTCRRLRLLERAGGIRLIPSASS